MSGVVEESTLPSAFPHRLGYACLNTVLRQMKPPVFCSRTTRIATITANGSDILFDLGRRNVQDLEHLIRWNDEHNIRFMRMSSDMFPFASHELYGYSLHYCAPELKRVGDLAKRLGHRLTTHPSQTNNLGSPTKSVVASTRRDLMYHAEMFDLMGLDRDSVMIIHGGGVYGDKEATLKRWEKEYLQLPVNVKDRLVVENDEFCYSAQELLPICEQLSIPLVFDWHHHALNPGTIPLDSLLERIQNTWTSKGIRQKMHYSESRTGILATDSVSKRRAHSDFVKRIPMCGAEVDLMIEAKMKEQAVLEVYRLYGVVQIT